MPFVSVLPRSSLPDDLAGLPRWTAVVLTMTLFAEILHFFLTDSLSFIGLIRTSNWLDGLALIGMFFGVPACVVWIGGYPGTVPRSLRWAALIIGFGLYIQQIATGQWNSAGGAGTFIPVVLGPLGLVTFMAAAYSLAMMRRNDLAASKWLTLFALLALLLGALGVTTRSALRCTSVLFPATWDYHAYRIDGAFYALPATFAAVTANAGPWLQSFTATAYSALSAALYVSVALAMRQGAVQRLNVWRVLIVPFCFAWIAYAWLPLSGPLYTFFDGRFPHAMPGALEVPAAQVVIPPAYRNGMPSMHLTGSLLVWMMAVGLRNRVAVLMSSLLVFATIWSTLASGEHYAIDLVVALPCAGFLGTAIIWPQRLFAGWRTAAPLWLAGAAFLVWMIALRAMPLWLSLHWPAVRALAAVSSLCAGVVFWNLVRQQLRGAKSEAGTATRSIRALPRQRPTAARIPAWIVGVFVASGVAGLFYEVVYAKALAVTFGSTALASYTVLATYMGGMAMGAWLGGRFADRVRNPLRAYAACEAIIGCYAAATPYLFVAIQAFYVQWSLDTPPDAAGLTLLRLLLGGACLGLPTLLMGATFPLMFKHLRSLGITTQGSIAPLYSANVGGAAAGSILAGYLLIPALGRDGGTYVAAAMSLVIALYALDRHKRHKAAPAEAASERHSITPIEPSACSTVDPAAGAAALIVLLGGGAVTLALEINSMHLLAVVAGNSVYAFGLMLATFLTGLGLGSMAGHRLMRHFTRLDLVTWAQCGIALAIALTTLLWDQLPSYFSSFGIYPVRLDFSARETVRALVCAIAMLPPAFFIGMSYPAAMSLATDWLSPEGHARGVGVASGVNTLGNIAGVVLTGFWLLPHFGSRDVSLILAATALLFSFITLLASLRGQVRPKRPTWPTALRWMPLACGIAALGLVPAQWNYDDLASGGNVYFSAQEWGKVIDHAESVEGGLTSVATNNDGVTTLLTNGKFQGNNAAGGEMVAQESFALFPLLHTAQRESALVIGYGTGMTTRVLHDTGFKQIDVAELSKDIVALADKHFVGINQGVSTASGVTVHYTDGRNYLLTQSRQFDLVSIEITSIWFAGAANLYNRDFYALAKKRLSKTGVLQQWVQLHHITPLDLAYVLGSVRAEFEYVWLYVRGGQGIVVASNSDASLAQPGAESLIDANRARDDERQPEQLRSHLVLSPAGIDRLVRPAGPKSSPLASTDRNLYLEHSTPKGNALGDVLAENIRILSSFEPTFDNAAKRQATP